MFNLLKKAVPKKILSIFWLYKSTLQEHYFRISLREVGIFWGEIKINHENGTCWHKKTGWVPICFPLSMVNEINKISKKKTSDYFFSGVIVDSRKWLNKYPNVKESNYGRSYETKYKLDVLYYKKMCESYFGLSPVGDCPWSYRFFESIMCLSLPILGDNDKDIFCEKFYYLRDSTDHIYSYEKVKYNYEVFLQNHILVNILKSK